MRQSGGHSIVRRVRANSFSFGAVILACCLGTGCTVMPSPAVDSRVGKDPNALTVVAEIALERGECKVAAENYADAALRGPVTLARRASEVAVGCEHMPAAWQAVQRWYALSPDDEEAALLYAEVALRLYRIPEARDALTRLLPQGETYGDDKLAELMGELIEDSTPSAVLAALTGPLDLSRISPAGLALLGELALDAQNVARAERFARDALALDAKAVAPKRVLARVYVMQGDELNALATARQVMREDAEGGKFELADVLVALDRFEEARIELARLRAVEDTAPEANRRLALLALESGDLAEAQWRLLELASNGQAGDVALLYLADIAVRDGDTEAGLAGYKRLIDSSVALTARTRAADLLLEKSDRTGALELLDDYVSAHPESLFEMTLAKAHLFADHGELDVGLALVKASLERHPRHPSLEYDQAVLLERDGQVKESVAVLERMLVDRPEDPVLLNALGYTLADHGIELHRAETLIRRALVITPDSAAALDSLGWVRFKQGDARGAVVILQRAYELARDAEIAAHWGEALWVSGDQQQARKVWAAALARTPDSDHLKATVDRIVPAAGR